MFFSTAVHHSIWQSHITQCSNLLKCNAGNANFGKVPKPSENSKKMDQKYKKHNRGSPIAFTCIMQVIYIIQFKMGNLQASSTNFTLTCQKYLDVTSNLGPAKVEISASL